jgi:hypothetical protein
MRRKEGQEVSASLTSSLRKSPVIRLATPEFLYLMLVSMAGGYASIFFWYAKKKKKLRFPQKF